MFLLLCCGQVGPVDTTLTLLFPAVRVSSSAATSMVMLSLLLVELLRHDPRFQRRGIRSFGARFASVALPSLFVMWVGATRTQDHYHTFGDVLAGCVVGTMSAAAAHSMESLPQLIAQGGVNSATGVCYAGVVAGVVVWVLAWGMAAPRCVCGHVHGSAVVCHAFPLPHHHARVCVHVGNVTLLPPHPRDRPHVHAARLSQGARVQWRWRRSASVCGPTSLLHPQHTVTRAG